eukprot:TRINITY_DN3772_c1_g1_i1.p1 TRINITY_DN3772_c1_g1~~TRINITY_DN3772_c1_g1_i1.p1  ORF type:complete len:368 (+),score=59.12 TRINITY_DN3772_c1_g1_i1:73-1176(+)
MSSGSVESFGFKEVRVGRTTAYPDSTLPIVIYPLEDNSLAFLKAFCERHAERLQDMMITYGAVLFRGFDINQPQDFEDVALQLEPRLDNRYLGTSPRTMVTEYTFTASELPNFFPIPQHLEMSFLRSKPSKLFFFCEQPPKTGGSTPLCHFGKVWESVPDKIRDKLRKHGVKYIRNYCGPNQIKLDPTQLKSWPSIFGTTDKKEVESICKADGLSIDWKPNGGIRLTNCKKAFEVHPITKQEVWHNHSNVFHPAMAYQEYKKIAQTTGGLNVYWLWFIIAFALCFIKWLLMKEEDQSMNCVYGNGEKIENSDMEIIRNVIWKNCLFVPWEKGDVIMIDNNQVSHGRFPYINYPGKKRRILVAWGDVQ